MIYTVTFNPAIDCYVWTGSLIPGAINRCDAQELRVGGKGINVSKALQALGLESVVLGFVAGGTGRMIEEELARLRLRTDLTRLAAGLSRINIKIQAEVETAINASGPILEPGDFQTLSDKMDRVLRAGDTLVLSGNVPARLPDTIYAAIAARFGGRVRLIADAEGGQLRNTLRHRPFLVKPNVHELGDLFGAEVKTEDQVLVHGRKLCELGARNVLVSRGPEGAVLICGDGPAYAGRTREGGVRSTVGAGDAMVAGFIAGFEEAESMERALAMGLATGAASVFSPGDFTRADIESLAPGIRRISGQ